MDEYQSSVRRQHMKDLQASVKLLQACVYQGYSLKSARLAKEVSYVLDSWDEYVTDSLWTDYRGPCYAKAQAEGKLEQLKARLVVWMMEGLRPECIRSDFIDTVREMGAEYLEAASKTSLLTWIEDLEPLLGVELEASLQEVLDKLKTVVSELKALSNS